MKGWIQRKKLLLMLLLLIELQTSDLDITSKSKLYK